MRYSKQSRRFIAAFAVTLIPQLTAMCSALLLGSVQIFGLGEGPDEHLFCPRALLGCRTVNDESCVPAQDAFYLGFAAALLISILLAIRGLQTTKWAALVRVLVVLDLASVLIGCISGVVWSKHYWNYPLRPPRLDERIENAVRVVAHTSLEPASEAFSSFLVRSEVRRDVGDEDSEYPFRDRAERILRARGLMKDNLPDVEKREIRSMFADISAKELFFFQHPGYNQFAYAFGTVIEVETSDKENLVLLEVRGGQLANDHHPFYEFVFRRNGFGKLMLHNYNRFYFDVAGAEGTTAELVASLIGGMLIAVGNFSAVGGAISLGAVRRVRNLR